MMENPNEVPSYPAEMDNEVYFDIVSRKCANGRFRFSPYREKLISRGGHKIPRVICIPSLRDKVVQRQITESLHSIFPESSKTPTGSRFIKEIINVLSTPTTQPIWIYHVDIQQFYDEIPRDQLLTLLAQHIQVPALLNLIKHAIETPSIPNQTKRQDYPKFKRSKGVPQGLSISGVLANIFLHPVDIELKKIEGIRYFRFVDDILTLGEEQQVKSARIQLESELAKRQLKLHTQGADKEHLSQINEPFSYLGYHFSLPNITVRSSSIDRLKLSIVDSFLRYKRHEASQESSVYNKQQLINMLNLRITGAISSKKEYGWLFYYRHITDKTLLHQLDAFVKSLFKRHTDFNDNDIKKIKRFSRAHFEIKHNLDGHYIYRYKTTSNQRTPFIDSWDENDDEANTEASERVRILNAINLGIPTEGPIITTLLESN